jgi:hypothetical protein
MRTIRAPSCRKSSVDSFAGEFAFFRPMKSLSPENELRVQSSPGHIPNQRGGRHNEQHLEQLQFGRGVKNAGIGASEIARDIAHFPVGPENWLYGRHNLEAMDFGLRRVRVVMEDEVWKTPPSVEGENNDSRLS